ncbi:MAG: PD-(D/E)XK nuclease domain-containing protein, partial [Muribaculaceae bacterium]|nr:PD-(D/E)XK nuclease domain-containing protein [Muribaculaceae bacterium]
YVMELKLDRSAEEALEQIERKEYALPWKYDGRKVFKIGIGFSSAKRNIDIWKIVEENA